MLVVIVYPIIIIKNLTLARQKKPPQWPSAEEKVTLSPRRKPVARQPPPIQRKPQVNDQRKPAARENGADDEVNDQRKPAARENGVDDDVNDQRKPAERETAVDHSRVGANDISLDDAKLERNGGRGGNENEPIEICETETGRNVRETEGCSVDEGNADREDVVLNVDLDMTEDTSVNTEEPVKEFNDETGEMGETGETVETVETVETGAGVGGSAAESLSTSQCGRESETQSESVAEGAGEDTAEGGWLSSALERERNGKIEAL